MANQQGHCPTCNTPIEFNEMLEVVRCPECCDVFHPEYVKPLRVDWSKSVVHRV